MRTKLTLYPDIAAKAKRAAATLGKHFKEVINEALRIGLDQIVGPPATRPYHTRSYPMGLRPGLSYDQISELLVMEEPYRELIG